MIASLYLKCCKIRHMNPEHQVSNLSVSKEHNEEHNRECSHI